MKLLNDTDFQILATLDQDGRNVATNIAVKIDANRSYLNTRFQTLKALGFVRRVGPSERSGLYEITEKGKLALEHREEYQAEDPDMSFEEYLSERSK